MRLRSGNGCLGKFSTLKQLGDKAREEKQWVYVGFVGLEKVYNKVISKL